MSIEIEFLQAVKNYDKIIIYGCGNVGKITNKYLTRCGIDIICFAVSNTDETLECEGTPVREISSLQIYMQEALFIVATSEKLHDEIVSTLHSYNAKNIFVISDSLCQELRRNKEELYKNAYHERKTHLQYKDVYTIKDDKFVGKYSLLIKGLDEESVKTVNKVLKRLELIFSCKGNELDLFDLKEKEQLKILKKNFYDEIVEHVEGIYTYKNYVLPQRYFDPSVFYYKLGIDFFGSTDKFLTGDFIDAGAFIGDSTLLFSKMTTGTVYAWEAMGENCKSIKKTLKLNDVHNVEIVNKAVGRLSHMTSIEKNEQLNWSTILPYDSRDYKGQDIIEMKSIDDFVKERNVKVSLIKLHVEGMEYDAVRGAQNTLITQRPALIIQIHHTPKDFFEIKPYIESLNLGYRFKIYKPINGSIFTGTMLLAEA